MNDLTKVFEDAGNFYIHYNKINIGSRSNTNNLTRTFAEQKKIIASQVKSDYIKNFDANLSNSSIELMSAAVGLTQEEFLTVLNDDLEKKLQNELAIDKLEKLHSIINDKEIDFGKTLNSAVDKKSVEELSKIFEAIASALTLLEKDSGGLGAILLAATKQTDGSFVNSFKAVGDRLSELLDNYKIKNNYKIIKKQSLISAKTQLQNLAYVLKWGKFKSTGSDLTAKGLSRLLLNCLISTSIAEGLSFASLAKSKHLLYKAIIQTVGTAQVLIESDDQEDYKITGKTDIKASGVNLSLQGYDFGQNGGEIKIDIGISSKFYKNQSFNSDLKKPKGVYGSGSGGTLGDALRAIWDNPIDRYLVYNFFTHEMYQPQFNDLIATRQILRLFSTAGSEDDFAQFMLVNGRVVNIWDIVKYAISSDLSISSSLEGESAGIVLSIPNRPKIFAANQYDKIDQPKETKTIASWNRSRKVNSEINSARIKAELHLSKLIAAVGNKY